VITDREGMALLMQVVRKQKRQRQRREALGKFVQALVKAMLTITGHSLFAGLWFMLAVGVIHHEWIAQCPTIGYWWAVLVAYLLRVALVRVQPPTAKAKAGTDG
jgi:hypothetical protein